MFERGRVDFGIFEVTFPSTVLRNDEETHLRTSPHYSSPHLNTLLKLKIPNSTPIKNYKTFHNYLGSLGPRGNNIKNVEKFPTLSQPLPCSVLTALITIRSKILLGTAVVSWTET